MKAFNLDDPNNILRKQYSQYGKANGLLLAHSIGLPVSTTGWVCHETFSVPDKKDDLLALNSKVLCRPDAPIGYGNKLPRGRDLYFQDASSFRDNVRGIVKDAIVLVFPSPSICLVGKFVPRHQISGGLMVIIDKIRNELLIEFVGKGFDVGDITRGLHIHTSISIPLHDINGSENHLFFLNRKNLTGTRRDIEQDKYDLSRANRIRELRTKLGENNYDIEQDIPISKPSLDIRTFRKLLQKCIFPVLYSSEARQLGNIYGVMINLYGTQFYVFELWQPIRSIPVG